MTSESVERFWDKYIDKTKQYKVSNDDARCYVGHVEDYIKAYSDVRLAQHLSAHLENYLTDLGRNPRLTDWRFAQIIQALQILFTELVCVEWAKRFPWEFWFTSASHLPNQYPPDSGVYR